MGYLAGFLGILVIVLLVCCAHLDTKHEKEIEQHRKESIDYVVTYLFMNSKIDVDTYVNLTLPNSTERESIQDTRKIGAFLNDRLYAKDELSAKVNSELKQ